LDLTKPEHIVRHNNLFSALALEVPENGM
jgi:hypothetical protein